MLGYTIGLGLCVFVTIFFHDPHGGVSLRSQMIANIIAYTVMVIAVYLFWEALTR